MPIRKKGEIEIKLQNPETEEEDTFVFPALGMSGIMPILRKVAKVTVKNTINTKELKNLSMLYAHELFVEIVKTCKNFKIIEEGEATEEEKKEADYFAADFNEKERAEIMGKLTDTPVVKEGEAAAENFRGEK